MKEPLYLDYKSMLDNCTTKGQESSVIGQLSLIYQYRLE